LIIAMTAPLKSKWLKTGLLFALPLAVMATGTRLVIAQDTGATGQPTHTTPSEDDQLFELEQPEAPPSGEPVPGNPPAGNPANGFRPTITDQPAAPPAPAANAPKVFGVILGGLDKIAARTAKFEVNLAKSISYNTLIITAHSCRTRPPEEPPESAAYLDIEERRPDGTQEKLFSGWMFASSPALNALEHPIYDVWVVSCKTARPDTAAPAGPNS
jgi:hypothetical protein